LKQIFLILFLSLAGSRHLISSEAVGFYSKGKLKDPVSILDYNLPIHKVFTHKPHHFATEQLVDVVAAAAEFVKQHYPDYGPIQLGDLSSDKGGKLRRHLSHQNGLDADIVYLSHKKTLQAPEAPRWEQDFIRKRKVTDDFFFEGNLALFKFLIHDSLVERIIVDKHIKKALCHYARETKQYNDPAIQETLRRLRPAKFHHTHFHMRIMCPIQDVDCRAQLDPIDGPGC